MYALLVALTPIADPLGWSFVSPAVPWSVFPAHPPRPAAAPVPAPAPRLPYRMDYETGARLSKTTGTPLVTFVGDADAPSVAGAWAAYEDRPLADWWPKKGAVVSVWVGNDHLGRVLTEPATAESVRAAVARIRAERGQ